MLQCIEAQLACAEKPAV